MKLYTPTPEFLIRLQIRQQGSSTEYLTFCETTTAEVKKFVVKLIEAQKLSPFQKGNLTSIDIREATGGKNGKSTSLSFKGLTPQQVKELILKNLP